MGEQRVVFVLPPDYEASKETYPAVIAFAGLGESVRGNRAGAWGWVERYGVVPAMAALHRRALTGEDFQGLVRGGRLKAWNAALAKQAYRGLVLVCPYPPRIRRWSAKRLKAWEAWLLEELIPYTERHLRVVGGPEGWGVDGISLGGLLSTYVGFKHPEAFSSIGSVQGAVSNLGGRIRRLARRNREVLATRALNVATSKGDGFRRSLKEFHTWLGEHGLPHRFTVLPGRHDKRFVKGPGSLEMLLFHDRALRGGGPLP